MIVMKYNHLSSSSEVKWKKEGSFAGNEPISVLDTRSPSPSTSTSTAGGGGATAGGGGGPTNSTASLAAVSGKESQGKWSGSGSCLGWGPAAVTGSSAGGGSRKEELETTELHQISSGSDLDLSGGERFAFNLEDWEGLVSEPGHDPSLLRWISGDLDSSSFSFEPISNGGSGLSSIGNNNGKIGLTSSNSSSAIDNLPIPLLPGVFEFENPDAKPQVFNQFMNQIPQIQNPFPPLMNTQQNHLFQPQPKRQNLGISDSNPSTQIPKTHSLNLGNEFSLKKQQTQMKLLQNHRFQQSPLIVPKQVDHYQQQKQAVYDQLYKASELILASNFPHAQEILARLNHSLSPLGKSFQRAAFYFKEALQLPLLMPQRNPTPSDFIFKIGAYKSFSEVSPITQFMNFTSNQALLEALDDANHIHILDFEIGFGAQWASFMQELPGRNGDRGNLGNPSLKITAFASPSTHHPLELALMHENLTQFASEIGVHFELEVVNFDSFDPNSYSLSITQSSENEAIAVNLPIWSFSNRLSALPSILRFIKQLSPRVIVSFERGGGCEGTDLPFSHHILHSLQYHESLLDSMDSTNVNLDTSNKIERFLLLPKIENIVLGRLNAAQKMPNWKSVFASAGFLPVGFSNFNETQAECVVKRIPCGGFHVEKRQMALMLCWQRRELVSASAWRC